MQNQYVGLVHHPILNKSGEIITTSVTNLDIHDIARSARTFGFNGYYIITPIKLQQELVGRILSHWNQDVGNVYNPDRQDALRFVKVVDSIEAARKDIEEREKHSRIIQTVTGANFEHFSGDEKVLTEKLEIDNACLFLLFGTGWGLHASVIEASNFMLDPISGAARDGYNHLSVRSAVAIYLDRISRARRSL